MGSRRLPGKVLIEVEGKPLLHRLCDRMKLCRLADEVIVATSAEREDDAIAGACARWGVPVFRGPAQDLTSRLLGAARIYELDAVVRVTGDNPLTDPGGIDDLITEFFEINNPKENEPTIVHNMHRNGYPYGMGAEVVSRSLLEVCDGQLCCPVEREHFAQFVKEHADQFKCRRVDAPAHLLRPQYFLTVDYSEDLVLQRAIYEYFRGRDEMSAGEIVEFLDANPALARLNCHLHQQFAQ